MDVDRKLVGVSPTRAFSRFDSRGRRRGGLGRPKRPRVRELGAALVPESAGRDAPGAGLVEGAAGGDRVVTLLEDGRTPMLVETVPTRTRAVVGERVRLLEPVGGRVVEPLTRSRRSCVWTNSRRSAVGRRTPKPGGWRERYSSGAIKRDRVQSCGAFSRLREGARAVRPAHRFVSGGQHLCANVRARRSRTRGSDAAGVLLDEGRPARASRRRREGSRDEAAVRECEDETSGPRGMGFTWEVDAQWYLKRAAVLATQFGGAEEHAGVWPRRSKARDRPAPS